MKKLAFLLALLVASASLMAQSAIQFKTLKQSSIYLTPKTSESNWSDEQVYHGFEFSTQILWPVSGLPAAKLTTLRQLILDAYASEDVYNRLKTQVNDAKFFATLHGAMVRAYRDEDLCVLPEDLRAVSPSAKPSNVELSSSEQSMSLKRKKYGVYTLFFDGADYCEGAAHPMGGRWALNYDVAKNRKLTLADLLLKEKQSEINRIYCSLVNSWQKRNGYSDFGPFNEKLDFRTAIGWYISDKGIVFMFDPYEIAPYSEGIVEITFPIAKYKHLFRPDALKFWGM